MEFDLEYEIAKDCYRNGRYEEAIKFLLKPAQEGNLDAGNDIGVCYERIGDYEKAAFWYSVAGVGEKATPNLNVANLYLSGKGLSQDIELAIKIYLNYAQKGYASAYEKLGDTYLKGKYVKQDYKKAYAYLLKGAKIEREKKDSAYCLGNLGYINHEGIGKAKNEKLAIKYYKEAAELGNEIAQYNLGQCYLYGQGCKEDIAKAIYWFTQSAQQYYDNAMIKLSELYAWGTVVKKNKDIAMYWINKAIDNNAPVAFIKCAEYYLDGDLIEKDYYEAYKLLSYYRKNLLGNNQEADKLYDELKSNHIDEKFWRKVEHDEKGATA